MFASTLVARPFPRFAGPGALFLLLAATPPAMAGEPSTQSLLETTVTDLSSGRQTPLSSYVSDHGRTATPLALVFFEPECTWCARQLRDLEQRRQDDAGGLSALREPVLASDGIAVRVLAVGVNGDAGELGRTLRRTGWHGPGIEAGRQLVSHLEGVPATPYWLLIDPATRSHVAIRGYLPPIKVQRLINALAS